MKDLVCGRCGVILKDTPSHFWNYHHCAERLELEQRAFEEHCKSSETYGKYFWEYWPKHLQESADEVDDKHHNVAFHQRYMRGEK